MDRSSAVISSQVFGGKELLTPQLDAAVYPRPVMCAAMALPPSAAITSRAVLKVFMLHHYSTNNGMSIGYCYST
jgi:hypothetical protein